MPVEGAALAPTPHERTLSVAVHYRQRPTLHFCSAWASSIAPAPRFPPRSCPSLLLFSSLRVLFHSRNFFSNSSGSVAASPLALRVRGSRLPASLADGGGVRKRVSIVSMFVVSSTVVAREASVIFFHPTCCEGWGVFGVRVLGGERPDFWRV